MDGFYNSHFIMTDGAGRITDGWSDGPQRDRDPAGAICLNDKGGYQFRLFPGGQENPPLYTMDGIPLYKWDGQSVQPRTNEEIEADRAALPKPPLSEVDKLKLQLAAATDRQEFLEDCIAEMAAEVYNA